MEKRKIQKTGGNTYIVSLPIQWVRAHKLAKNTPVGVIPLEDGTLLITPTLEGRLKTEVKEIEVNENVDDKILLRSMIAAYIMGFDSIRVHSENGLQSRLRGVVREFSKMAIGLEITEEDTMSVTLKDLLNPSEMPFEKSLGRMHIIVKGMIEDIIMCLTGGDREALAEVITRDSDVNRLHWLISRQSVMIVKDPAVSLKMGVERSGAVIYSQVGRHIERIGDHIVRVAENLIEMWGELDKKIKGDVVGALRSAGELFDRAMESLFNEDLFSANDVIESAGRIHIKCENIVHSAHGKSPEQLLYIGNIVDSIKRISDYSTDICESVINLIVGKGQRGIELFSDTNS